VQTPDVRIDLQSLGASYANLHSRLASDPSAEHRMNPRRTHYDYLELSLLRRDVERLIGQTRGPGLALDLGSGTSPYSELVASVGLDLRTLDITPETNPDYVGTADATGLETASVDLVICTQVIEHVESPSDALREIARILRPGGQLILTAPHVWFFHPHPTDYWRFTQQGIVQLLDSAGLRPKELLAQGGSVAAFCQIVNFLGYGVMGKLGAPVYATMNALAGLDRLVANDLFCLNFACLAERPAQ
jgi:SAM-dependent methyltransferase